MIAQELSGLGENVLALEKRIAEVERETLGWKTLP